MILIIPLIPSKHPNLTFRYDSARDLTKGYVRSQINSGGSRGPSNLCE